MNDPTDKAILTVVITIVVVITILYATPWRRGYFFRSTRSVPVYTETVRTIKPSSHSSTSTIQTGGSSTHTSTTTTTIQEGQTITQ